jgi:hypothetical protein
MRSILTLLTLVALALPAAAQEAELPQGSEMPQESQGAEESQWPELPRPSELPELSELPQMPANWEPTARLNSAGLAAAGMENTGTAALSLLDGQHAIVTFWTADIAGQIGQSLAFRCVTFFDEDLVETSETCDQAVSRRE